MPAQNNGMRESLLASLISLFASAGQSPALVFPAASNEYNRRYATWLSRSDDEKAPPLPAYCPCIDVIAQEGVPDKALDEQSYPKRALIRESAKSSADYILYLFKGDKLHKDALLYMAAALSGDDEDERPDLIYADEDICDKKTRSDPHFKAPLNEIDLLSRNCIGRPMLVRRELDELAGGLAAWDEAAAYAYALRCARLCGKAKHIGRVLLSRESLPHIKDGDGRAAIDAYIKAKRQKGYAVGDTCGNTFRIRVPSLKNEYVAIIVPNKNELAKLRRLLESIENNALYPHYRIIVVDHGTEDLETLRYYDLLRANRAAQILHAKGDNLPSLWNYGALNARSPYLLFLRSGTELLTPGFLVPLMEIACRDGVGAAGCRCFDTNGSPLAEPMISRDLLENLPWTAASLRASAMLRGECIMIRSETFFGAGCFDETVGSAGAAAELCLRLMRRGRTNVVSPSVRLAAETQSQTPTQKERQRIYESLRPYAKADPYFSPLWSEVWNEGKSE